MLLRYWRTFIVGYASALALIVSFADEFDELFSQTWIGENPTPEKNRYLVLHFNFAEVDPEPQKSGVPDGSKVN